MKRRRWKNRSIELKGRRGNKTREKSGGQEEGEESEQSNETKGREEERSGREPQLLILKYTQQRPRITPAPISLSGKWAHLSFSKNK